MDMSRYHEEAFGPTPPEIRAEVEGTGRRSRRAPEVPVAELNQVEFISTGKSIRVVPGETVHAAAAKLGLHIPKACGMGICGTCKVMKTAGEVEMEHNGGITDEDVAEGYILSCCSVPKGDVRRSTIDRHLGSGSPSRVRGAVAALDESGGARIASGRRSRVKPLPRVRHGVIQALITSRISAAN